MRDLVGEIELAKPPVAKVQLHLRAEAPFVPNAVAVAHNQHPDHQFRINRRPADRAVIGPQLLVQVAESSRDEAVHPPQQMIPRNDIVEIELIEQSPLISILSAHHPRISHQSLNTRNQCSSRQSSPFFDSIDQKQKSLQHSFSRSFYSITSPARPSSVIGTVSP